MVQDNRKAINATRDHVKHLGTQPDVAKKLMGQLVKHQNRASVEFCALQKRLETSESNLNVVATNLMDFRRAYVEHLDHEKKVKMVKRGAGVLASIVGFVLAPVLKEAFDALIDLANPIKAFALVYPTTGIKQFLVDATKEHALQPAVESHLEKLKIPKNHFETMLREEIVLKNPELLDECEELGDLNELVGSIRTEYVESLDESLSSEADGLQSLLDDLKIAVEAANAKAAKKRSPLNLVLQVVILIRSYLI